jgi:hypothetical protein
MSRNNPDMAWFYNEFETTMNQHQQNLRGLELENYIVERLHKLSTPMIELMAKNQPVGCHWSSPVVEGARNVLIGRIILGN